MFADMWEKGNPKTESIISVGHPNVQTTFLIKNMLIIKSPCTM